MKSTFRINWFVDFDKEEQWLNKLSSQGLCFWHTNGLLYRFKECKPGEFTFLIDFDEKKSSSNEDYVVFRSGCGDQFVHQYRDKIYWKRAASQGPFESEDNVQAKLRMTNKAYNFHVKHLLGLTLIMAFGAFICFPLGQFILPESLLATQVATLGLGLAGGILLAECILLVPAINKLRKKMGELIKKAI